MQRFTILRCLAALAAALVTVSCQSGPELHDLDLRVVAYNIKHGEGMDGAVDLARAADVLRATDADVITLQEVDRGTKRTLGVDQAKALGKLLGMNHAFAEFMPYQGGSYGMAVLTKHQFTKIDSLRLPDGPEPRAALSTTIRFAGERPDVTVVGIHLYGSAAQRLAQARSLREQVIAAERDGVVTILAGDFNSRPGDPVMEFLQMDFALVPKHGPQLTFPSDAPNLEIDYFLVRPTQGFRMAKSQVLSESRASDHRPIQLDARLR